MMLVLCCSLNLHSCSLVVCKINDDVSILIMLPKFSQTILHVILVIILTDIKK